MIFWGDLLGPWCKNHGGATGHHAVLGKPLEATGVPKTVLGLSMEPPDGAFGESPGGQNSDCVFVTIFAPPVGPLFFCKRARTKMYTFRPTNRTIQFSTGGAAKNKNAAVSQNLAFVDPTRRLLFSAFKKVRDLSKGWGTSYGDSHPRGVRLQK